MKQIGWYGNIIWGQWFSPVRLRAAPCGFLWDVLHTPFLSFLVYGCKRGPMAGAEALAYRLAGCKSQFDSGTDGHARKGENQRKRGEGVLLLTAQSLVFLCHLAAGKREKPIISQIPGKTGYIGPCSSMGRAVPGCGTLVAGSSPAKGNE